MAKKLTNEQQAEMKMLLTNKEMLDNSKKAALSKGNDKAAKQIERAQEEVISKIKNLDPSVLEEKKEVKTFENSSVYDIFMGNDEENTNITATSSELVSAINSPNKIEPQEIKQKLVTSEKSMYNEIDPNVQYDVIELPSNGQCYKEKIDRVPVAYLTAYDENIITSPNLYKDGLVIDFLLKNKVMTKELDVNDLVSGDADAIILFLRATSYGPEFPITVNDPQSGEQIDSVVDLTKLKPKEFKLIGDENGHFEFETPIKKDKIKFRYLTRNQEKQLQKLIELESNGTKAFVLDQERETLAQSLMNDKVLSDGDRNGIKSAMKLLEEWSKRLREINDSKFTQIITNNMLMQITAVNGNYDRDYIRKYVNAMPARDSLMLRKYINDNKPGIDFTIEVERPQSLGGGSFSTFLNWDDSVFLNISDL